jgi:hypothetical protein
MCTRTVLRHERVVGGGEVDKPVPGSAAAEEDGAGVQRVGHHGGAAVGDHVGAADDVDVAGAAEDGGVGDAGRQLQALRHGGLAVQVHHVLVARVVQRVQRAPQAVQVALGAGDEVGQPRHAGAGGRRRLGGLGVVGAGGAAGGDGDREGGEEGRRGDDVGRRGGGEGRDGERDGQEQQQAQRGRQRPAAVHQPGRRAARELRRSAAAPAARGRRRLGRPRRVLLAAAVVAVHAGAQPRAISAFCRRCNVQGQGHHQQQLAIGRRRQRIDRAGSICGVDATDGRLPARPGRWKLSTSLQSRNWS